MRPFLGLAMAFAVFSTTVVAAGNFVKLSRAGPHPECVFTCTRNAWVYTDCKGRDYYCMCKNKYFLDIIYHCFTALCEPDELDPSMDFTLTECAPYMRGGSVPVEEVKLFENVVYHNQDQLNHIHAARAVSGSILAPSKAFFPIKTYDPRITPATTPLPHDEARVPENHKNKPAPHTGHGHNHARHEHHV